MKTKYLASFASLLVLASVMAVPALAVDTTIPVPIAPLQPGNSNPVVYLINRTLSVDGVNPYSYRNGQYAFTGEKITYNVLVRDQNGASDVTQAIWEISGIGSSSICSPISLAQAGGASFVNSKTGITYTSSIDVLYNCILTIGSWSGSHAIDVKATDLSGGTGTTVFETMEFNPALSVNITTNDGKSLSFGPMDQTTRTSLSNNTLRITNTGTVDLWAYLAGSDFYSTNNVAKCSDSTNALYISQFKYQAIAGTTNSGWQTVPKYNLNAACDINTCRNGVRIPASAPQNVLSNGGYVDVSMSITFPIPCSGVFDNGTFYVMAKAV